MRNFARAPALLFAFALQFGAGYFFIRALIIPPPEGANQQSKTQVIFLPMLPTPAMAPPKRQRRSGSSNTLTGYFNPDHFDPERLQGTTQPQLAYALSACDVDKYDMASDEVKAACNRIGALIRHDPGRFGFTTEVVDAGHWQTELARREAPYLLPCMSPKGFNVLYTLSCIYEEIFTGHREDKRLRYSD